MSVAEWPSTVYVGHTNERYIHIYSASTRPENGNHFVILDCPLRCLTPGEARLVAAELVRQADMMDMKLETR